MAFILKGIAIVYIVQMTHLEGDTKVLLSQMNGDYAWSYLNRKQKNPEVTTHTRSGSWRIGAAAESYVFPPGNDQQRAGDLPDADEITEPARGAGPAVDGPAGEGPGRRLDVGLPVVPLAQGEELQELPGEVLVRLAPAAAGPIQIEQHGRVPRNLAQEGREVPQGMAPQQPVLARWHPYHQRCLPYIYPWRLFPHHSSLGFAQVLMSPAWPPGSAELVQQQVLLAIRRP